MFTSHRSAFRAWTQPLATLLLATSLALFTSSASASATSVTGTTLALGTAISSTMLQSAIAAQSGARRLLAHSTVKLDKCLHVHRRLCTADRSAARRARTRLANAEHRVYAFKAITARTLHSMASRLAPKQTVSGETLHWTAIPGARSYVFVRKVPGQTEQYSTVTGTSITPTAAPGATVSFTVRTDVKDSEWAREVSITYPQVPASSPPEASSSAADVSIASSLSTAAPFAKEEPFVKGISTNIQGWGTSAVPDIASEISALGVKWAREDLAWSTVEPQKGTYDWGPFDEVVAAARANGITILPVVGYAPPWASPGDATDYAAFVKAAVERYGPGSSANLIWWELWNEPYAPYAWSGHTPEPEAYARDVFAAAQAAKEASPRVKLLIAADYQDSPQTGGSSPWQTTWIDDMFTAVPSLGHWIDGVSVHPYGDDPSLPLAQPGGWKDANGEWAFQRIDTIREKFLAHGVNVPFWITEAGQSTWEVSEAVQARYYADLAQQVAARPWVRALFPYCLREFDEKPTNNQSGFGLLKFGSWQPKAAFYALQAGLKELS